MGTIADLKPGMQLEGTPASLHLERSSTLCIRTGSCTLELSDRFVKDPRVVKAGDVVKVR